MPQSGLVVITNLLSFGLSCDALTCSFVEASVLTTAEGKISRLIWFGILRRRKIDPDGKMWFEDHFPVERWVIRAFKLNQWSVSQ